VEEAMMRWLAAQKLNLVFWGSVLICVGNAFMAVTAPDEIAAHFFYIAIGAGLVAGLVFVGEDEPDDSGDSDTYL
jgi:hypothetical protein